MKGCILRHLIVTFRGRDSVSLPAMARDFPLTFIPDMSCYAVVIRLIEKVTLIPYRVVLLALRKVFSTDRQLLFSALARWEVRHKA